MAYEECPGCMGDPPEDHVHQYINALGDTTTCWWIEGRLFKTLWAACKWVEDRLDCDPFEAAWFVRNVPTKYN